MNKKTLLLGAMLIILPLIVGRGLTYVNEITLRYVQTGANVTWCIIWKGIKSIPIFAYIIGMFMATRPVLVKQNRVLLSGCAFIGAAIVLISFILPLLGVSMSIVSVTMFCHYQLLAPLAIGNIILGIYIHRRKAIRNK